ncbi:hypothetical protein [Streptomyces sp. HUAS ZL42]|uniref:hypothetical protein n=1 Tax=Streptomyces sp. HUAS ZL42 TaxID=3231715 RepID=UPI00345EF138
MSSSMYEPMSVVSASRPAGPYSTLSVWALCLGDAAGCASPVDPFAPDDCAEVGADPALVSADEPPGRLTRTVTRMLTTGMTIPATHQAQRGC